MSSRCFNISNLLCVRRTPDLSLFASFLCLFVNYQLPRPLYERALSIPVQHSQALYEELMRMLPDQDPHGQIKARSNVKLAHFFGIEKSETQSGPDAWVQLMTDPNIPDDEKVKLDLMKTHIAIAAESARKKHRRGEEALMNKGLCAHDTYCNDIFVSSVCFSTSWVDGGRCRFTSGC